MLFLVRAFWLTRTLSVNFSIQNNLTDPIIRGYGKVSSSENSEKVTPDTAFMIASVSKIIVGAAVLVLVDQGKIDLDDDICHAIPEDWDQSACRNPKYPNTAVTWRMLVTHRSSLRGDIPTLRNANGDWVEASYGPSGGYAEGTAAGHETCPMDDVVGFYRDFMIDKETETSVGADLNVNWYQLGQQNGGGAWKNFEPGSRTLYSNFAVGYIAALVELLSGQSFPDFCREKLFEPLDMDHTAWFRRDLPESTLEAIPTEWIRRKKYEDVGHYCFIDYASGSLRTTANDMAKFLHAMLDFGSPILWSNETGRQAVTCQERDADGEAVKNCEFGVNWILLDNSQKGSAEFWLEPFQGLDWSDGAHHDGAEAGSQTQIVVLPKAGVYVVVFTNTDLNDDWAAQELALEVAYSLGYSAGAGSQQRMTGPLVTLCFLPILWFWWL